MIDKVTVATLAIAGLSKLVAEIPPIDAGSPNINSISNLTATGALIVLVLWLTTRTLPAIVKDFRDEMRIVREDRDKERDRVKCAQHQQDQAH